MRKFRKKYNSLATVAFLFAYTFIFTANLFHVHNCGYSNPGEFESLISASTEQDDPFSLGTSICFLDYICTTINLDSFASNDILFFRNSINFFPTPGNEYLSSLSDNLQYLRAPPSFC